MDRALYADLVRDDLDQRDPAYVAALVPLVRRAVRVWFRSEVRDVDRVPAEGGVLVVSNHSGGLLSVDVPIIVSALVEAFGPHRPVHVLGRDLLLNSPAGPFLRRCGVLPDLPGALDAALADGAVAVVFPGGDHDSARPTLGADVVDFDGNLDYVRTAVEHDVPIVPVVSTGGQQAQLHLSRGERLAQLTGAASRWRLPYLPVSVGFPFGLSVGLPPNLPLPTKITTQVLDPVRVLDHFGPDPDPVAVDEAVRALMQAALDELRRQRRFPVLG